MSDISETPASRTPLWIALAALGGVILGIGGVLGTQAVLSGATALDADTRLAGAVRSCTNQIGVDLTDSDRTLSIDVKGEKDRTGAPYATQACILQELEAPGRVISHIEQTTSIDGRQTESWDGITIEWSYHPSRGSDMVIVLDD